MRLFKSKILLVLTCFFVGVQCNLNDAKTQPQKNILKALVQHFEEYPMYYQTLEKERVLDYLKNGLKIQDIAFLSAPADTLYKYFDNSTTLSLLNKADNYTPMYISTEDINGFPVVNEDDIPEFLINNGPPPFNYSGFTNVNFLSTPIISRNRAIVFHDSYSHVNIGITIHFFVKDENNEWRLINSGVL